MLASVFRNVWPFLFNVISALVRGCVKNTHADMTVMAVTVFEAAVYFSQITFHFGENQIIFELSIV